MSFNSPSAARLKAALTSSVEVSLPTCATKSVMEPSGIGTLSAMPYHLLRPSSRCTQPLRWLFASQSLEDHRAGLLPALRSTTGSWKIKIRAPFRGLRRVR
jgi:hypothetical protein